MHSVRNISRRCRSSRQYMQQCLTNHIELTSNESPSCIICSDPAYTSLLCQLYECCSQSFNHCRCTVHNAPQAAAALGA
jgi:hypothetical protein